MLISIYYASFIALLIWNDKDVKSNEQFCFKQKK